MSLPSPTPEQLARLKYLVGYQLWPHWEAFPFAQEALAQAVSENEDLRLVAAYVLEQICEDAGTRAANLISSVKRIRVGPIDVERNTSAGAALKAVADAACTKAATLRHAASIGHGGSAAGGANPAPILDPWGVA